MSWLQNDMFNEMVEEARIEALTDEEFAKEVARERILKDIDLDDEIIETAISKGYYDVAWYSTCSRSRLVDELLAL